MNKKSKKLFHGVVQFYYEDRVGFMFPRMVSKLGEQRESFIRKWKEPIGIFLSVSFVVGPGFWSWPVLYLLGISSFDAFVLSWGVWTFIALVSMIWSIWSDEWINWVDREILKVSKKWAKKLALVFVKKIT